jgi:mannose-6-phosphate isomerase-like protein (cupin superfamily)
VALSFCPAGMVRPLSGLNWLGFAYNSRTRLWKLEGLKSSSGFQDQRIHTHPESDKIYFVLSGRGLFHIAGEERELTAGEAVVARPGQSHGVKNSAVEDLVLLVFMMPRP